MVRRVLVLILMLVTFLMTACALDLIRLRASDVMNEAPPPEPRGLCQRHCPDRGPNAFAHSHADAPSPPACSPCETRLASAIDESGINAAVAVTDLQTGESIDVNGDEPRHAGCTLNWFVLLSNVVDIQNGTTAESEVGSLISRTIYGSNPVTARDLLIRTGGGNLDVGVIEVRRLLVDSRHDATQCSTIRQATPRSTRCTATNNIVTANDMNRALAAF